MTDRGREALRQSRDSLTVGPSSMRWTDGRLVIDLRERGALPMLGQVVGRVIVTPSAVTDVELPLTDDDAHVWRPFAPTAEIEVRLDAAGWQWRGHGYFDANFGTRALEEDFASWTWGRYPTGDGSICYYDATRRDGSELEHAVRFGADGRASAMHHLPKKRFSRSLWAVQRMTRSDADYQPRQVRSILDAPFYSRSLVQTRLDGVETTGVHEALDLSRFRMPLLKPMLAVRVPRRSRWTFS
jgi:carotenoid 1,2-hydratase